VTNKQAASHRMKRPVTGSTENRSQERWEDPRPMR
jgi:hypothetical protein